MPTVLWINGLRVVIYSNDHSPPHVHVIGGDRSAKYLLNCPDGPVAVEWARRFRIAELRQIERELNKNLDHLCEAWREIHGDA
jgi:hypothetical protein